MADHVGTFDLLTVEQLRKAALNSIEIDLTQNGSPNDQEAFDAAVDAIEAATGTIEGFLNRKLIVRNYRFKLYPSSWTLDDTFEEYWRWSPEFPLVEIGDSDSDVTIEDLGDQSKLILDDSKDPDDEKIIDPVYAGYKRSDQDISGTGSVPTDLTQESELSGLTVAPEDLPRDVVKAAVLLALHDLHQRVDATLATGEIEQTIRGETITLRGAERGFEETVLGRLAHLRKMPQMS